MISTWYQRLRVKLVEGNRFLSNAAYTSYKFRETSARTYKVSPSSDTKFLVETPRGHTRIVELPTLEHDEGFDSKTEGIDYHLWDSQKGGDCTCGMWEEYDCVCSHAIAAILFIRKDPFDYITFKYKLRYYRETYSFPVEPVTLEDLVPDLTILPPIKKQRAGRPKTVRIRNRYLKKVMKKCGTCREFGHYKNRCPNQPVAHGRAQRAHDRNINDISDLDELSEFEPQSKVDEDGDPFESEPLPESESELETDLD
jgi:hypothetical protein